MTPEQFEAAMDQVARAREQRDRALAAAQEQFTDEVIAAYRTGLTVADIGHATGVSVTTLRSRFRERGVEIVKASRRS